jgi:hypothetical protein
MEGRFIELEMGLLANWRCGFDDPDSKEGEEDYRGSDCEGKLTAVLVLSHRKLELKVNINTDPSSRGVWSDWGKV